MTMDFTETLNAIVERAPADMQSQFRQNIDLVVQAGATSFTALTCLASDEAEPSDIRSLACWLLGQLRQKRAASALLQAFSADNAHIYWEAAKALAMIDSKRALRPLTTVLHEHCDEDKRVAVAYTLSFLNDARSVGVLLDVLNNEQESPRVRGQAAEGLAYKPREHRIIETLLKQLQDPAVDVQFWSAFALAHQGGPEVIPELEALAAHSNAVLPGWWAVRDEARWAITAIAEPDKAEELLEHLVNQRHME